MLSSPAPVCHWALSAWIAGGAGLLAALSAGAVLARPVPDNTLPDRTVVSARGDRRFEITGGTRSADGRHLFHSFDQFSVPTGGEAVFLDGDFATEAILGRVTGSRPSRIDGAISVANSADLVLLNPNGILFGPNATLDLGGAFVATTAEAVLFDDGNAAFSAASRQPPLLTLQTPTGLQFGPMPQPITLTGAELSGAGGRTLALIGGGLTLNGAQVTASQGRVELGAIAAAGRVDIISDAASDFAPNWRLAYPGNAFGNIRLNRSRVNTGLSGGEIQVQGRRLSMTEGSQLGILAQGEGSPADLAELGIRAGDLTIRASASIAMVGPPPGGELTLIFNNVAGDASGSDSELRIDTPRLTLRNGAQISANNAGSGSGVNLAVMADTVQLTGFTRDESGDIVPSGLFARVGDRPAAEVADGASEASTARGGNLTIEANRLRVQRGAQVSTSIASPGQGGTLSIDVRNILVGGTAPGGSPSALFATVEPGDGALGDGGNLDIDAAELLIRGGAQVGTTALGRGDGGQLTIAADTVRISGALPGARARSDGRSGLFVTAEPAFTDSRGRLRLTTGDAGRLSLTAATVVVADRGLISANNFGTDNAGATVNLNVGRLRVQGGGQIGAGSLLERGTSTLERGPGGTIVITAAEEVRVTGSGQLDQQIPSAILTQAEGTGNAGNILINGGGRSDLTVTVSNGGTITAEAIATTGGNIQVRADAIRLLNDGDIRTNVQQGDGGGGDITLTARTILALGDSDILAFAQDVGGGANGGAGGSITLNTPAFFGEGFDVDTLTAAPIGVDGNGRVDINASGAIAGAVSLPDVSFIQNSLAALPERPVSTETLIANSCVAQDTTGGTFIVAGAGGLQARPGTVPTPYAPDYSTGAVQPIPAATLWQPGDPVVEAEGLYRLPNGELVISHACSMRPSSAKAD